MKTCLVAGGAGFIGSHIAEFLHGEGHTVRVVDNLVTGRKSNLAAMEGKRGFSLHVVDVTNHAALLPLFQGVDWVFHLAALADIVPSIENPQAYHHANVNGTLSVLEAARLSGAQRFVYAASSSCYGIPDLFPTPETAPIRPMYPYALTKWTGECYVQHWCRTYGLPAISLRLFNVYGPRSRTAGTYGAVFGVFLRQKLAGQPFTIVGDGTQSRDFTYVEDVARAFVEAAKSNLSGEIFNVGSGHHYSVNYLTQLLGGPATFIPKRPGEPDCTFADTSRIRQHLGWQPNIGFEEGVGRVLSRIEDWRDAPLWTPESISQATQGWFKHLGTSAP
jgi:UDP-glucose 4-epimerase